MESPLSVADLMTKDPACVYGDDPVADVFAIMTEEDIRHVPVIDSDGGLEGIITQRDLMRHVLYAYDQLTYIEQKADLKDIPAKHVMTPYAETVTADQPLAEAGRLMLDQKIGCLPVTDGKKVVGIITESDFIKHAIIEPSESRPATRQSTARLP